MSDTTMAEAGTTYLAPSGTTAEGPGTGAAVELGAVSAKTLLLVLRLEEIREQESLHVSVWGSADGQNWGTQALFWFPQKFYAGVTPAALDLTQHPEIKFLQARWETNRWGRGVPLPFFRFSLELKEAF